MAAANLMIRRNNPDMEIHLAALAEHWGGIEPLAASAVVREALRRCYEAEGLAPKKAEKPEKRPRRAS